MSRFEVHAEIQHLVWVGEFDHEPTEAEIKAKIKKDLHNKPFSLIDTTIDEFNPDPTM